MPTSVHLPAALLQALDRKARALRLSRNRVIVNALERDLAAPSAWSPGFFERLGDTDAATRDAIDEMRDAITVARSSKRPVRL